MTAGSEVRNAVIRPVREGHAPGNVLETENSCGPLVGRTPA
jgi:hypothetical protein